MSPAPAPAAPPSAPAATRRFGPLLVMAGVRGRDVVVVFAIALVVNIAFAAIQHLNPYILESRLGLGSKNQGAMTGTLLLVQELVLLLASGTAGALTDKIGRRHVLAAGALCLSAGFLITMEASTPAALIASRVIFALGVAAVATTIMIFNADLPAPDGRARWAGTIGLMNGLGAAISGIVVTQLPVRLLAVAGTPEGAGTATFVICALIGVVVALASLFGLKGGAGRKVGARRPILAELADGFRLAARSRELRLAYAASLAARADLIVISGFLFLWNVRFAVDAGLGVDAGYGRGREIFLVLMIGLVVGAPIIGLLLDRIDRTLGLTLSFALAAAGYLLLGSVPDPTQVDAIWKGFLLGLGEAAAIASSVALVSQHAPVTSRGSVIGTFSTFGALGMLLGGITAGYLFDHWKYSAPFLMMGFVNTIVFLLGLYVFLRRRRETANQVQPAQES